MPPNKYACEFGRCSEDPTALLKTLLSKVEQNIHVVSNYKIGTKGLTVLCSFEYSCP